MAVVLIVEDEKSINELMARTLKLAGHESLQAFTAMEAMAFSQKNQLDLVLLDINLPDLDGFTLKKFLGDVPVVFVTARDGISDRVKGLDCGGEDYILKPFDIEELLARIRAVLRRNKKDQDVFQVGEIRVNLENMSVLKSGIPIELTNREFELLRTFLLHRNMALSREKLLELAWGYDYDGDDRTVDIHVQRLRKKLQLKDQIKTVFKVGYRLEY